MDLNAFSSPSKLWFIPPLPLATALLAIAALSSSAAGQTAGGQTAGRPTSAADPGVISHAQMLAIQRQYQANQQGVSTQPLMKALNPGESPCSGESFGGSSTTVTQAQIRRISQQQARQVALNAAKAKAAAKKAKPTGR